MNINHERFKFSTGQMLSLVLICLASGSLRGGDVLLISVDGLMPKYLLDADQIELKIPSLRRLMREGSVAERARSVMPSVTFPAHTSMITGVNPIRHGIENNLVLDPDGSLGGGWYWYHGYLKVPNLFDLSSNAGIKTASVTWPVTVGAPIDQNLPDLYPVSNLRAAWNLRSLTVGKDLLDILPPAKELVRMGDDIRTRVALHFLRQHPDFMAIHFLELDGAQHRYGPGSPEALETLERIDVHLSRLFHAISEVGRWEETTVVVVSDHGFLPVIQVIRPGVLLKTLGLIRTDSGGQVTQWHAAPWAAGGSLAICLAPSSPDEIRGKVLSAVELLQSRVGYGIRKVYRGSELNRTGGFSRAFLVLEAQRGFSFSNDLDGELVGPSSIRGTHGYDPTRPEMQAAFLIKGPGIKAGFRIRQVRLIDVAPTIALVLGLTMSGIDGRVIQEIFDD